ncbi:hypothetical protein [Clostridium estertheticum]|uniref:hypothetical protein n=1 Tax=Clostridium estertheticum TaxID=238834 RepID=UPI001C0D0CA4|nr:hypothetical protein [Clostridium estertheticum]MBU3173361.1 hypothetical protein [Clostridium estertheticum]
MNFSFEESELVNVIIEELQEMPVTKEKLLETITTLKNHTEGAELVGDYKNIIEKITSLNDEKYNLFISNLPVENLTNY